MSYADTNSQQAPKPNDNPAAWSLVIKDMAERDIFGAEKYRTRLQPLNGRDALIDAYQEALDLVVYLRAAIYERDNPDVRESVTTEVPVEFGHQNQYTGQGGVMLHCPDCTAEHCPCMAK